MALCNVSKRYSGGLAGSSSILKRFERDETLHFCDKRDSHAKWEKVTLPQTALFQRLATATKNIRFSITFLWTSRTLSALLTPVARRNASKHKPTERMKRKYALWITPLIDGGVEIIIHEKEWRNDGSGKISGFVNHRFRFSEDDFDPTDIRNLRRA